MTCKQCETLLEHYSESVRLYSQVSHSLRGIVGEDFTKGVEEAEKLRITCQEAHERLLAHWRSVHDSSG